MNGSKRGIVVAIDGPAASGKGPLARRLADRYGRRVVLTACLAVFGVFPHGDVDEPVVNGWKRNDAVPRRLARDCVNGILGIAVELP